MNASDPFGFDTPPDAWGAHAQKFDDCARFSGIEAEDVLPMWVADMDFAAAPPIRAAIRAEADRGYMGYWGDTAPVSKAVAGWLERRHGWQVPTSAIRYTHGVVAGFATSLAAYSDPGDAVVLFTPVYHSFFSKAKAMGRAVLESPLVTEDGVYRMDLASLEAALTGNERIVVLCSPHNPGGRLWSAGEIAELCGFCARHDLILISDEIHMDLTFPGQTHVPTAVAAPDAMDRIVVLTAASKGFNIAGGETGLAIVPDPELQARFDAAHAVHGGTPNRFGMLMTKAAFSHCDDWSDAVRGYLAGNFELWRDGVGQIPGITVMDMPSTYLSWVDFAGTGMSEDEVARRVGAGARIATNPGRVFGSGGETFRRFNLAMSRAKVEEAVARMQVAFGDLQ